MDDRDLDVTYEVSSFVAELRRLADALERGAAFSIQVDGEDVTIPEDARLSVAYEREDGAVELEFQMTWTVPKAEPGDPAEDDQVPGKDDVASGDTNAVPALAEAQALDEIGVVAAKDNPAETPSA